jgi:hypothetical protein
MRRFVLVLAAWLLAAAVTAPGCNIFNDIGNYDCSFANQGTGGDDGAGDDDGAGGDQGVGGGDPGAGASGATSASATVGAGGAPGAGTGAGSDPGSGVGAGDPGARHAPRRPGHVRRHHHREDIGTAVSADCMDPATPVNVPPPPPPAAPPPNWVGLDTGKLRSLAIQNKVNDCDQETGIAQNRLIGLAFETWVLKTKGQLPRWRMLIDSQARAIKTKGLPKSVIPEFVDNQIAFKLSAPFNLTWDYFPNSLFFEVKAVNGTLVPSTSKWQILGLLNVATTFPTVPSGPHAPPAVIFTTTSNTTVSTDGTTSVPGVVAQATTWGVAVWQEIVYYDANSATPNNPNLHLGKAVCLNSTVYTTLSSYVLYPGLPWQDHPLTWTTVQEQNSVDVPGDPDSPAVVP